MKRFSWAVAVGRAVWAAVRLAGADRLCRLEAPVAPLLSFTPYAAAAAPLVTLAARRTGAARVAAPAAGALAAVVLPRAVRRRQPEARGPVLGVLTANLLAGRPSEEPVVDLVPRTPADPPFLQQLTHHPPRPLQHTR